MQVSRARVVVAVAVVGGLTALGGCARDATPAAPVETVDPTPSPTPPPSPTASPTPTATPTPTVAVVDVDPCTLVTGEEASTIIKLPVGEPERTTNPERPRCVYGAPPEGPVGRVEILVGVGAENVLGLDRDVLGHELTPIEGIGDEAYTKDHQIFFRKGDLWVLIGAVRIVEPSVTRDAIDEAARRAASRM